MADEKQVLINESTLKSMADTIREKKGLESFGPVQVGVNTETVHHTTRVITKYAHTSNINDSGVATGTYGSSLNFNEVVTIEGATSLHIKVYYATENQYDWVVIWKGNQSTLNPGVGSNLTGDNVIAQLQGGTGTTLETAQVAEYDYTGNTVTFGFKSDSGNAYYGYYAVVTAEFAEEWDEVVETPIYEEQPINLMLPMEMVEAVSAFVLSKPVEFVIEQKEASRGTTYLPLKADEINFPCFVLGIGIDYYSTMSAESTTKAGCGLIMIDKETANTYKVTKFMGNNTLSAFNSVTPFTQATPTYTGTQIRYSSTRYFYGYQGGKFQYYVIYLKDTEEA